MYLMLEDPGTSNEAGESGKIKWQTVQWFSDLAAPQCCSVLGDGKTTSPGTGINREQHLLLSQAGSSHR